MRYDIDVGASLAIVNTVESVLDAADRSDIYARSNLDTALSALRTSRVGPAFSTFAETVAMADIRSVIARGWNTVGAASTAIGTYQSGDGHMADTTPSLRSAGVGRRR